MPSFAEGMALFCLVGAVIQSFASHKLQEFAGNSGRGIALALVLSPEIGFFLWGVLFLAALGPASFAYLQSLHFREPFVIAAVMLVCSTRPVLVVVEAVLRGLAKLLPLPAPFSFLASCLVFGPLLGSFISEPAAMTIIALLLRDTAFSQKASSRFRYGILALLLVNVSIGGVLTPFAAPPIIMVAERWGWGTGFLLRTFGWKAVIAIIVSTAVVLVLLSKEIKSLAWPENASTAPRKFLWKEALLVLLFLIGLTVLGGYQRWWLEPVLPALGNGALFVGSIGLTAVVDNAALTYLGAQLPTLSESQRYFLVAGSIVGGGLTVIANAPNPVAYEILKDTFANKGIRPISLFLNALLPTGIAALCFWCL